MIIIKRIYDGQVTVFINCAAGLYVLPMQGGAGKSFLYEVLKSKMYLLRNNISNEVTIYSINNSNVLEKIGNGTNVILLDKADRYTDKINDIIKQYNLSESVVLVDLKNRNILQGYHNVILQISDSKISILGEGFHK